MNAIDLLESQHREVEKLFARIEKAKTKHHKDQLFAVLADELAMHAAIEEHQFYPAVRAKRTEDILLESLEGYLGIKRVLADLLDLDASDESFDAKITVLQEQVEHHVEEEETDLFPKARKVLDKEELIALGAALDKEKHRIEEHGAPRRAIPSETAHAAALSMGPPGEPPHGEPNDVSIARGHRVRALRPLQRGRRAARRLQRLEAPRDEEGRRWMVAAVGPAGRRRSPVQVSREVAQLLRQGRDLRRLRSLRPARHERRARELRRPRQGRRTHLDRVRVAARRRPAAAEPGPRDLRALHRRLRGHEGPSRHVQGRRREARRAARPRHQLPRAHAREVLPR